jgi:type I restriction enzyme, S subunit
MPERSGTVDPSKFPDEEFDLYSVPAFDSSVPEILPGRQIGSAKQVVKPGDVLLSKIVPHIRRAWIVGGKQGRRLIASSEWIVFRDGRFWGPFLRHLLVSDPFHAKFMSTVSGVGGSLLRARPAHVAQIKIPEPPLPEQQRIAAILDQTEALRAKRRHALAKLELLTRSVFLDFFGDPGSNPKGLPVLPLGEIARFIGGGTPSRAVPAYYQGAICWATSKDMKGELLRDTQEHITERAIEESATNLAQPGTILVVVKSKILMHHLPVLIAAVPTCFGQDLKGIILNQPWSSRYVARHLRLGKKWLLDRARGVNTEGLTLEHLREYPILVPPPVLAKRYEQLEQAIELQRERMKTSLSKLDALFASLQHRAFRGEL